MYFTKYLLSTPAHLFISKDHSNDPQKSTNSNHNCRPRPIKCLTRSKITTLVRWTLDQRTWRQLPIAAMAHCQLIQSHTFLLPPQQLPAIRLRSPCTTDTP